MPSRPAITRCPWAPADDPLYVAYHDEEWGVPVHDDLRLFEMLTLESAQAGLAWITILRKREGYRRAFAGFDPEAVARFDEGRVEVLLTDAGIVRNRRKIEATIGNARAFLALQNASGSFDRWLWRFVDGAPIVSRWRSLGEIPTSTALAATIAKELKGLGFRFLGPTTIYAFLQATGLVNDHLVDCFRHTEVDRPSP